MNFITLELDITKDPKIKLLMEKYKNALIVWIYLLIKFGKEENNGFMIFINENWYKNFSKELKFPKSQIKNIKEIIKEMANIGLINSNLFFEDILFSENFFKKHFNYFYKNKRDFNQMKEKIIKNLEFLFNSRNHNEMYIMTFEEISKFLLNLFEFKSSNKEKSINKNNDKIDKNEAVKNVSEFITKEQLNKEQSNNGNENKNNLNQIKLFEQNNDEQNNNEQLKEEQNNEEQNDDGKIKIQFSHNTFQYKKSEELCFILSLKDRNNINLNRQEGARMIDKLLEKYTKEEIVQVLAFFGKEINKQFPNNIIKRVYSFSTFFTNFKGLLSLSGNINPIKKDLRTKIIKANL
ncbi:MAG TPA: DUF4373 domain-containing protein [Candidatus Kapabacteria bacterium]|nr:DUF4373 domain-containing protein [Candidatus Kapabacteria bacterium]